MVLTNGAADLIFKTELKSENLMKRLFLVPLVGALFLLVALASSASTPPVNKAAVDALDAQFTHKYVEAGDPQGYGRSTSADLKYTPGQSLEKLYELKPQWKAFQDTPKATAFLRDAAMVIDRVYPFPVLQLQADSDASQPQENFADPSKYPGVTLKWITNANHFDNLDQPQQVAEAINTFLRETNR